MAKQTLAVKGVGRLATDIGSLIESTRGQVAQVANAALTTLYWEIGQRVRKDVLARSGNCLRTAETIVLEPLQDAHLPR